jgi:hypothetical protein
MSGDDLEEDVPRHHDSRTAGGQLTVYQARIAPALLDSSLQQAISRLTDADGQPLSQKMIDEHVGALHQALPGSDGSLGMSVVDEAMRRLPPSQTQRPSTTNTLVNMINAATTSEVHHHYGHPTGERGPSADQVRREAELEIQRRENIYAVELQRRAHEAFDLQRRENAASHALADEKSRAADHETALRRTLEDQRQEAEARIELTIDQGHAALHEKEQTHRVELHRRSSQEAILQAQATMADKVHKAELHRRDSQEMQLKEKADDALAKLREVERLQSGLADQQRALEV